MKYMDTGFRAVYDNFTAFPVNEKTRDAVKGFPGEEEADCILTFGYVDDEGDVALEAIACGKKDRETFRFFNGDVNVRGGFKAELAAEDEFLFLDGKDGNLGKRYADKLKAIPLSATDEVLETRKVGLIDSSRDLFRPDEVSVYLAKSGLKTLEAKVMITGLGDGFITGSLLEDVDPAFGAEKGDSIAFVLQEVSEGNVVCAANMNAARKLKKEDLEDGRLLKNAIQAFLKNRGEDSYIDVLEILRDSDVWVPCTVLLSEQDQKKMDMMVNNVLADRKAPGGGLLNRDAIRAVPEYLKRNDEVFLPVFTSEEEMKNFGDKYTKVRKHILEWIEIALRNDHGVSGIALNPFTDCFMIRTDIFDVIKNMKSSISEN